MAKGTNTKETIKRQALNLFVAQGVDGTGVREIAKTSGITEGAIYRHFKGKDELVWLLFSENYSAYAEKLEALQDREHGVANKLAAMIRGFCMFYDQDEILFRFLLLVQHGQLDKIDDKSPSPVRVVAGVIQQGLDQEEFKAPPFQDAMEATAWVFGIVLETATFKIYNRLTGSMYARADGLVKACNGALGLKP